ETFFSNSLTHFSVTGCWTLTSICSELCVFTICAHLDYSTPSQRTTSSNQHQMPDKMRWYMIAFCIFLTLSVLHFVLAAPVVVGEIREVVLRDEIATWEKWMDPNDDAPGIDIDAQGIKERGWVWPGEWEQDPSDINPPKGVSSVGGSKGDGDGGDAMQNSQRLAGNMSPAPQSERPATAGLMTFLRNWFQESAKPPNGFRPRNSASGPAGMPMWEFQGTVDSNAARVTSASSVHDLPFRRQRIPDQLD
ncbi:hypothetical protein BGY98DRAFT_714220, partial [Russula aff. rugulosa BPL654]